MSGQRAAPRPQVWGGIECTVNRVGDAAHRQFARNGHYERLEEDLDACASLGVTALRYPVLWEEVESPTGERDFTYRRPGDALPRAVADDPDRRSAASRQRSRRPPRWTIRSCPGVSPTSPERSPGGIRGSPTGRRSTSPSRRPASRASTGTGIRTRNDDPAFVTMLLNEVKATILAMRAIREVNPDARLIQTEDFGRTGGTRPLHEQVSFENERRWLTFDLLCGRVRPASSALRLPHRHGRRRPRRAAVDRRQRVPARHPGAQPLPAQQPLAGPPPRSVPPGLPRGQRPDALRRRRGMRHPPRLPAVPALAPRGDVAPLRDPDRRHRGAHLRPPRRARRHGGARALDGRARSRRTAASPSRA